MYLHKEEMYFIFIFVNRYFYVNKITFYKKCQTSTFACPSLLIDESRGICIMRGLCIFSLWIAQKVKNNFLEHIKFRVSTKSNWRQWQSCRGPGHGAIWAVINGTYRFECSCIYKFGKLLLILVDRKTNYQRHDSTP